MRLSALLVLAPIAAAAQTLAPSPDPVRAAVPPTGVAIVEGAAAAVVNPAALALGGGTELLYTFERTPAFGRTTHALWLSHRGNALSGAVTADWSVGALDARRLSWALAVGSERFALGIDYHWLSSDEVDLDGLSSVDLGVVSRPVPFMAVGATVYNLGQPVQGSRQLTRSYRLGLGFRPLGDRYTLAIDYLFNDQLVDQSRMLYALQAEVLRGVSIGLGFSHGFTRGAEVAGQVAVTLNGSRIGATYSAGGTGNAVTQLAQVRASTKDYPALSTSPGEVVLLDLPDLLRGAAGPLQALGLTKSEDPFIQLVRLLERAESDPRLMGVILKIDDLPDTGLAKIEELRQSMLRLRRAGKKVIAVILKAEDPEYLLASAADRIYALPQSVLQIDGLRARTLFFGGTMDKLGVDWDVARVGDYKNAPDQLTKSEMSPEQREALNAVLDANFKYLETSLDARLSGEGLQRVLRAALIPPTEAVAMGLVDEVISPDELDRKLQEVVPGAQFAPRYSPFQRLDQTWGTRKQIAVVPIVGSIAGGNSRRDPFGGQAIAGADTVVKALAEAALDPDVYAIVLRIDSPGGDGLASDLIYRAVIDARRHKPVIASMGDAAASGGYYSAMGANEIFASATTLTGSIGVFFLKPAVGGLLQKLGVTPTTLTRGAHADFSSEIRPWTSEERQIAQKWVDAFYDTFISEAAQRRRMTKEAVDAVARGRVWSGSDAKARGLVDQLGGMHDALAAAKTHAGIPAAEVVDVVEVGAAGSLFTPGAPLAEALAPLAKALVPVAPLPPLGQLGLDLPVAPSVLIQERVLAAVPFLVTIR